MKRIPLLDLRKQIQPIRKEINSAIKRVIDQNDFILGKEVKSFEEKVIRYCSTRYAIGVSNGTDALKLSLIALGVGPGDGVLCPAFTYYATAGAVAAIGAIPIFVDIDPLTYNICPDKITEALRKRPACPVKAIIPVHLFGQCADMQRIMKIAASLRIKVVEDTAQAFGALYRQRKAGSFGDCGGVSFYPGKNLGAFGDAGVILTNNRALAEKISILRNQGNKKKYHHLMLGYNCRLDTIQAAVLEVKLKHLDLWNKKRRSNAAYYDRQLKIAGVKTPFVAEDNSHIYHQYVLRIESFRNKVFLHLNKHGVDGRIFYAIPLHLQPCFKYLGYKAGDFPEAEKASEEVLAIPVHPDLTRNIQNYVISRIKECLNG